MDFHAKSVQVDTTARGASATQEKARKGLMKTRFALLTTAVLCVASLASAAQQAAPPERVVADIDTRQTARASVGARVRHVHRAHRHRDV